MYEPTSDYAYSFSDVFQSPSPEEGGIYTLEEAGKDTDPWSRTIIRNRYANDLRMREKPQHPTHLPKKKRERFSPRAYARGSNVEYPGSSTGLRSARWDRPPVDNIVWDERPRSFRPNSDNLHAELFIPPQLRPWGGSGPSPYLAYPVESPSEAVSVVDRFSSGGAATGAAAESTPVHHGHGGGVLTVGSIEIGLQMVKVVLFLILIILLGMWMIASTLAARQAADIKRGIREVLDSLKK